MLKDEREVNSSNKKSKSDNSIFKTDSDRIENYSNLIYQIVSELGFLVPETKYENDPLRRKYQPSLKYRECLLDLQKIINKIVNYNLDIFDLIRCRIGEWKFIQCHFLPLFMHLIDSSYKAEENIFVLLEIIKSLIFSSDEDDCSKSPYYADLVHHNSIYKKYFSHHRVMGAFTTFLASAVQNSTGQVNFSEMLQITKLLRIILVSPESECSKGNLIQNLAYGRKEHVIASMNACKMCDLLFSLASSISNREIFHGSNDEVSNVFSEILLIIASIFGDVDLSDFFSSPILSNSSRHHNLNLSKTKKPIRHGRFSGSVSVQLSTGENMIINNSRMFASGIAGSLDVTQRKNGKLEQKMSINSFPKAHISSENRDIYLKLSKDFLESHFNNILSSICESRIPFLLDPRHKKSIIQISSYFLEFCRRASSEHSLSEDYYCHIYGAINVKFILDNIDYLHELISEKNYPVILKLLPFFKESLLLVDSFEKSKIEQRANVAKNILKQILHNKNVILLIKRVIIVSKPLIKYFSRICVDSIDILFKLIKNYSAKHKYWYVSSLSCAEVYSREHDSESVEMSNSGHESNFNFDSLIKHYATREIVEFYCQCLVNSEFEDKDFNSMLARYYFHVIKSEYFFHSLMRPSLITQLQKIITASPSWMQNNNDLVVVAKKIIRKFCNIVISDPSQLVMSFFN